MNEVNIKLTRVTGRASESNSLHLAMYGVSYPYPYSQKPPRPKKQKAKTAILKC